MVAYAMAATVITAPIYIAINFTKSVSLSRSQEQAALLADRSLQRNEQITGQVFDSIHDLEVLQFSSPCSSEAMDHMRKSVMRHSRLQAVGYVRGDRMLCSSLGRHEGAGIDVGRADYISSNGLVVRSARKLPYDDKSLYRISSSARSGFTAIVHTDNALDVVDEHSTEGAGLIGTVNLKPISRSGPWKDAWAKRLGNQTAVTFFDGEYVVGLKRSARYNYFTYAAIPEVRVQAEGRRLAERLIPVGIFAGLVLVYLVYLVTKQQLGIAAQLKNALLRNQELFLVYQPIVQLATGKWVGAEALLRWKRPDGEFVSPDVFIEIAEENGLMGRITRKVVHTIQKDAAIFLNAHPGFFISINASSTDLQQESLSQLLAQATRSMGIAPAALRVEATERTFIDTETAKKGIARLRDMGHSIAIDDFGTGYSSLSYLATLNVDGLKIDKSFVATIGTGAVTAEVVPHIIEMAKSLKLRMVAEGVETEEQADYLRARGVQMAQGWLYSRAISLHDLEQGLKAQGATAAAPDKVLPTMQGET